LLRSLTSQLESSHIRVSRPGPQPVPPPRAAPASIVLHLPAAFDGAIALHGCGERPFSAASLHVVVTMLDVSPSPFIVRFGCSVAQPCASAQHLHMNIVRPNPAVNRTSRKRAAGYLVR
jgi:hypothetical protein